MSKRVVRYIGMFHKEINHSKNSDSIPEVSWVGTVPDLENVSRFGDTLEEAIYNTKEACELYCDCFIQEIKQPSNLEEIMLNIIFKNIEEDKYIFVYIDVNVDYVSKSNNSINNLEWVSYEKM